jgi:predicted phosphoribosyltransferase
MIDNLRIVSRSSEPLTDRQEAGRLLGSELFDYRGKGVVVLGIPRGGLVVAQELAQSLDADLDIVFAHKLRAPDQPELAIGAIAENGRTFIDKNLADQLGIDISYLKQEAKTQQLEIARRSKAFRQVLPRLPLEGRIVIVTDDGVATGSTTEAALLAVRQENPKKLIAATPVGPESTIARLAECADEVLCLRMPPSFYAIGQFYLHFDQVSDEEVLDILRTESIRRDRK